MADDNNTPGTPPGNDGPEQFDPSNDPRVSAADEAARAKFRPQQPRGPQGSDREDETVPGGKYFHVAGNALVGHDAHGNELPDEQYPDEPPKRGKK